MKYQTEVTIPRGFYDQMVSDGVDVPTIVKNGVGTYVLSMDDANLESFFERAVKAVEGGPDDKFTDELLDIARQTWSVLNEAARTNIVADELEGVVGRIGDQSKAEDVTDALNDIRVADMPRAISIAATKMKVPDTTINDEVTISDMRQMRSLCQRWRIVHEALLMTQQEIGRIGTILKRVPDGSFAWQEMIAESPEATMARYFRGFAQRAANPTRIEIMTNDDPPRLFTSDGFV